MQEPHAEILPSFVALEQNPVAESLVVFESQSICAVLSALQLALEVYALKICDVKLARQSGGMNCVFLTGARNNCEQAGEALVQQLFSKYLIGHVEVIISPATKLREFFGFAKGL